VGVGGGVIGLSGVGWAAGLAAEEPDGVPEVGVGLGDVEPQPAITASSRPAIRV
jgi:hypothetical protein